MCPSLIIRGSSFARAQRERGVGGGPDWPASQSDGPASDSSGCRVDRVRLSDESSLHRVHRSSARPRGRALACAEAKNVILNEGSQHLTDTMTASGRSGSCAGCVSAHRTPQPRRHLLTLCTLSAPWRRLSTLRQDRSRRAWQVQMEKELNHVPRGRG